MLRQFYRAHYGVIIVAYAAGTIAAVCLVFIGKIGWDTLIKTPKGTSLITVFMTSSAIAAFFGTLLGFFKQPENIADHKKLYIRYTNLENEILTEVATGSEKSGKVLVLPTYLQEIDKKMVDLNKIPIGFDLSKLRISPTAIETPDKIEQ